MVPIGTISQTDTSKLCKCLLGSPYQVSMILTFIIGNRNFSYYYLGYSEGKNQYLVQMVPMGRFLRQIRQNCVNVSWGLLTKSP